MNAEDYKKCMLELLKYSLVEKNVIYTFNNFFILCIIAFLPVPYISKPAAGRGKNNQHTSTYSISVLCSISYSLKSDESSASEDQTNLNCFFKQKFWKKKKHLCILHCAGGKIDIFSSAFASFILKTSVVAQIFVCAM